VMNAQVAVECSENRARLDLEHVATVSFWHLAYTVKMNVYFKFIEDLKKNTKNATETQKMCPNIIDMVCSDDPNKYL
jgi:hypothetical protein